MFGLFVEFGWSDHCFPLFHIECEGDSRTVFIGRPIDALCQSLSAIVGEAFVEEVFMLLLGWSSVLFRSLD